MKTLKHFIAAVIAGSLIIGSVFYSASGVAALGYGHANTKGNMVLSARGQNYVLIPMKNKSGKPVYYKKGKFQGKQKFKLVPLAKKIGGPSTASPIPASQVAQ